MKVMPDYFIQFINLKNVSAACLKINLRHAKKLPGKNLRWKWHEKTNQHVIWVRNWYGQQVFEAHMTYIYNLEKNSWAWACGKSQVLHQEKSRGQLDDQSCLSLEKQRHIRDKLTNQIPTQNSMHIR
jgi:hypothetical protein